MYQTDTSELSGGRDPQRTVDALKARWRPILYAAVLFVVGGLGIHWATVMDPNWGPDGYAYLIRTQMDRGVPYTQARARARAFYSARPDFQSPERRKYLQRAYPQFWALFAPRVLYPWLAARLWSVAGISALILVSNAAFVAAILALYLLLLAYAPPAIAFVFALAYAAFPEIALLGRAALTDMLAQFFWILTMVAMCRYAAGRSAGRFFVFCISITLLSLTRPLAYMPLICAAALMLSTALQGKRTTFRAAADMAVVAAILSVAGLIAGALSGGPSFHGLLEELRLSSRLAPHASLTAWYAERILVVSVGTIVALLGMLAPPMSLLILWRRRTTSDVAIFAGALASSVPTILLNPIYGDIPRVVIVPILPVIIAGLAIAAGSVIRHRRPAS